MCEYSLFLITAILTKMSHGKSRLQYIVTVQQIHYTKALNNTINITENKNTSITRWPRIIVFYIYFLHILSFIHNHNQLKKLIHI